MAQSAAVYICYPTTTATVLYKWSQSLSTITHLEVALYFSAVLSDSER